MDPLLQKEKKAHVCADRLFLQFQKSHLIWTMIETSVQGNHTDQDPGVFKEVAGSLGMQNQWGMHQKCCNLRIGM